MGSGVRTVRMPVNVSILLASRHESHSKDDDELSEEVVSYSAPTELARPALLLDSSQFLKNVYGPSSSEPACISLHTAAIEGWLIDQRRNVSLEPLSLSSGFSISYRTTLEYRKMRPAVRRHSSLYEIDCIPGKKKDSYLMNW